MAISLADIDNELARREAESSGNRSPSNVPSVEDIDAELVRRGAVRPESSVMDTVGLAAKNVMSVPGKIAQNLTPEKMSPYLPAAGAVIGSLGGPLGSAAGAGVGQIGSRMADLAYGRANPSDASDPLKESIVPMLQTAVGGLPSVSGVFKPGSKTIAQGVGKGLARMGKTLSGVKEDVLTQATKQGYSTYGAPSMEKAQQVFGEALGPEGQAAMKQNASQVFDPVLGQSRATATEIGTKLEAGEPISAIEALKARQATDDIISATSVTDKLKRRALFDWRSKFDAVISSQNGPLKDASTLYRKAIVKDTLLNPTRLTKSGEPSAFLPLVLGAGGRGVEGALATLTGTSPAVWGAGATTLGQAMKVPAPIRNAAMAKFIDKVTSGKQ